MPTPAALFKQLKTHIGGNRELTQYEDTFGQPREEQFQITPPNPTQRRILSQLEFALALNQISNQFTSEITQALTFLIQRMNVTGTITKEDAQTTETTLLPLQSQAKEYSLILAAHAHIDMNWMWSWQETVASTLDTFRTMLTIMREYPDFHFSQSQASVYKIVEDYEPSMMPEIKQRIAEGRWEVTASAWVETDKNMPSGESLARHILYAKQYMHDVWGVPEDSMEIDFSPDTFGHSAHLPELVSHGGVKYYYHCRGNNVTDPLYRWRAPSGKEILTYREPYWYNSAITPRIGAGLPELARRCGGLKTGLVVYGVGDHGGGPTRRDVERAIEMQDWPIWPQVRFGTFAEYFKIAESVWDKLPVMDHEMNFIFPGCYTTQSRIKLGNRHSEAALGNAEAINALASAKLGTAYHTANFRDAWRNVLFTHFHDILTGSCVQDSREHAMGLYSHALAVANTQRALAMREFAQRIDTSQFDNGECIEASQSEGAGAGFGIEHFSPPMTERGAGIRRIFHIFNPAPHPRRRLTELTIWDWTGDLCQLQFNSADGDVLPHQLLQTRNEKYWDHMYFKVLVDVTVPAMGYTTIVMDEQTIESYPLYYQPTTRTEAPYQNYVLENELVRAEFCFRSGALVSLIDKTNGRDWIGNNPACFQYVLCDGNRDSAWVIGRYMTVTPLTEGVAIKPLAKGDLRNGFKMEIPFAHSTAEVTVTLDAHSPALRMDVTVDWNEGSSGKGPVPTLIYGVPMQAKEFLYDVPAGVQKRAAMHIDVPALTFAATCEGERALALATDCKYGFRGSEDGLSVTLIHASHNPDPYPERGIHHIRLNVLLTGACPIALNEAAFDSINDLAAISARPHTGDLPLNAALCEIQEGTALISGIKQAEDNSGLIVRMNETCGVQTVVKLHMPGVKGGVFVDIMEKTQPGALVIENDILQFPLAPNAMAAIKLIY